MKRKLIRLLSAMLVLVLAAGLLPSFASAAEPQAKDVAAAYLNVLKSFSQINEDKNQVRFYDVNGDSVPEMIAVNLVDYGGSHGSRIGIWSYQNGSAKKIFDREAVVFVGGYAEAWLYLLADGRLGWFDACYNESRDYYGAYYTVGSNGAYAMSDYFMYTYYCDALGWYGYKGLINGRYADESEVKAEQNKIQSGTLIFDYAVQNDSDETGEMTLSEARSFLNGIKGRFWDVPSNAFYANPVNWAVQNNVTSGRDALHFAPEETVKRGEAMLFFYAAKGKPGHKTATSPFKDVKKKHWYYDAVLWAVENKITSGTDATHFSPNKTCVRSEILQFLYAAMGKPGYTIANPYSDVKDKHWYKDGAIWAYEKGLEKGENGKFKANTPCTRAYVVTYLYRFITGRELVK